MTVPREYRSASQDFETFLVEVRDAAGLWSTHVSYTMVQSVFQAFRRRVTVEEGIRFAAVLPACLRALFVADWDLREQLQDFTSNEELNKEIKNLRPHHNFSTDDAIKQVAIVLRRHVDGQVFDRTLAGFSAPASQFWRCTDV